MEDAAEANAVLEEPIDLQDGVVGLVGAAVGHIIDVKHDFLHLSPAAIPFVVSDDAPSTALRLGLGSLGL